jgi:hypothetical protein
VWSGKGLLCGIKKEELSSGNRLGSSRFRLSSGSTENKGSETAVGDKILSPEEEEKNYCFAFRRRSK